MINLNRSPRRGISLIEVTAALTAGMVLMGAILTALIALQQADRQRSSDSNEKQVVAQLVERLRADVHAAQSVAWNERDRLLNLKTSEGREIVYARTEGRWLRTVDGASASGYRLPAKLRWRVEPADGSAGELMRIQLYSMRKAPAGEPDESTRAELAAVVGRDGRLLSE